MVNPLQSVMRNAKTRSFVSRLLNWSRNNIANAITLSNLGCGVLCVFFLLEGHCDWIIPIFCLALFFDFADGLVARMLGTFSEMGKQLDSLADMVTFGVLPGLSVFSGFAAKGYDLLAYSGLLIPLFSAVRLAKFNSDESYKVDFEGLPTPANAAFFMFLSEGSLNFNKWVVLLVLVFSMLMVSNISFFSLKFRTNNFSNLWPHIILFIFTVGLLVSLGIKGVPLIIGVYIFISVGRHIHVARVSGKRP